jgi:hypothetical protein
MHEAPGDLIVADVLEERPQLGRFDGTEDERVDAHAAARCLRPAPSGARFAAQAATTDGVGVSRPASPELTLGDHPSRPDQARALPRKHPPACVVAGECLRPDPSAPIRRDSCLWSTPRTVRDLWFSSGGPSSSLPLSRELRSRATNPVNRLTGAGAPLVEHRTTPDVCSAGRTSYGSVLTRPLATPKPTAQRQARTSRRNPGYLEVDELGARPNCRPSTSCGWRVGVRGRQWRASYGRGYD